MQNGFKIDARKFNASLDRVAVLLRTEPRIIVKEQAKLLLQRAQTGFTPPKTLAQGRAKIASDIYGSREGGLFQVYAPKLVENPVEGNHVTLWASKKEKRAYIVKRVMYWPSASVEKMREWHKSRYANDPNNRIKLRYPRDFNGKNFTDLNRPAVERGALDRYVKMMQKRVGRLKAGWNESLKAVGGKIQGWAARHGQAERDYGLLLNNLGHKDFPSITVGNQAPTITRWRKEWQTLLDTRARDMVKRAEFLLRKARKKGAF